MFLQNSLKTEKVNAYSKILRSNILSITKFNLGSIINIFKYDLPTIYSLVFQEIPNIIFNIVKIIIVLIVLITLDTKLAILFLILLPILFVVLWLTNKYMEKNYSEYKKLNDDEICNIEHDYQRLESIKINNLIEYKFTLFSNFANNYTKRIITLDILAAGVRNLFELICNIFMVIMFFIGIYLIKLDQLTIGSLIAFYGYFQIILQPIEYLSSINETKVKYKTLRQSFNKFININEENFISDSNIQEKIDLEFDNVSMKFNKKYIFKKLSFKIKMGEKYWIIGKNGSGKTTIIHLITRLYSHTNGKIIINNFEIDRYSVSDIRGRIGIVNQIPLFFHGSLEDNITLFGKNDNEQWNEIKNDLFVKNLFEKLPSDLNSVMDEKRIQLSLGQQKVISLIKVILQNKSVVVLDEYYSNLDIEAKEYSQYLIKKYLDNKTIISITHTKDEISDEKNIINLDK
jgi:ABC-type multidrug transport system fused ATPase/permease subunit